MSTVEGSAIPSSSDAAGARFVVIGDVIDDIVVRSDSEIRPDTDTDAVIELRPGGSGANVAAWLGWLGGAVRFVGTVGGTDVAVHSAHLAEHGARSSLASSDGPTGRIVVIASGQTRSMLTSRGANLATLPSQVTDALLADADHLHISGYSIFNGDGDEWAALIARAQAAGLTVSVDPSSAGYLRDYGVSRFLEVIQEADIVLPNLDEGRTLTGQEEPEAIAAALSAIFPLIALTLGPRGALIAEGGSTVLVPTTPSAAMVDATGAGDAFAAGFLLARAAGSTLSEAATAGHRAAGRAVQHAGGRPEHQS